MRQDGTKAEDLICIELKAKRLNGFHFVRQFPVGPYIADFACRSAKLIVEIDGSQHAGSRHDHRRDEYRRHEGFSTLRFWNDDVLRHRTSVCETILAALEGRVSEDVDALDLRFTYARPTTRRAASLATPKTISDSTPDQRDISP
jgi:very-short-patch-repair endonuclease